MHVSLTVPEVSDQASIDAQLARIASRRQRFAAALGRMTVRKLPLGLSISVAVHLTAVAWLATAGTTRVPPAPHTELVHVEILPPPEPEPMAIALPDEPAATPPAAPTAAVPAPHRAAAPRPAAAEIRAGAARDECEPRALHVPSDRASEGEGHVLLGRTAGAAHAVRARAAHLLVATVTGIENHDGIAATHPTVRQHARCPSIPALLARRPRSHGAPGRDHDRSAMPGRSWIRSGQSSRRLSAS